MFLINDRFQIDPASGNVEDTSTRKQTRLEPRILQLLLLLTEQPGKLVSRETLVNIIWKDYGGGDEGLTQGISVLRKALSDDGKEMIQTVPKKGYCFTGRISSLPDEKKSYKKIGIAAAGILTIVVALVLIFSNRNSSNVVTLPDDLAKHAAAEANSTNSITAKDKNNITYKLVMIEDRPPVFYREDSIVPVGQWERYQDMINYLKTELQKKRK